jgi:hypothetical protein
MADAYDIMSMAKRSGAKAQQMEDWEKYQDELEEFKNKQSKAGFWGGLGSLALSLLMPTAIPALASGGLGALLGTGAARGLTQFAGGEAIRSLFGGKESQPTYKGTSTGLYGGADARRQQREADVIKRSIKEELEGMERGRMFTSALSGFAPEIESGAFSDALGVPSPLVLPKDYGQWGELYGKEDYSKNPLASLMEGGGDIISGLLQLLQQNRDSRVYPRGYPAEGV